MAAPTDAMLPTTDAARLAIALCAREVSAWNWRVSGSAMNPTQVRRRALAGAFAGLILAGAAGAAPNGETRWMLQREVDKLDGTVTIGVIEPAINTALAKPRRPEIVTKIGYLTVGCTAGVTTFTFRVPGELVAGHAPTVSYRIDKQDAVKNRRWISAEDNTGVGLWKSVESVPFLKKISEGQEFFIRVEETVFGTTEATFNLSGLKEALRPIREACHW